jgi:hypothetical protein
VRSRDRSSLLRKRALRRLSHEQHAAYAVLYEQVLAETPGLTRHQARPRAWTRLRHEFPDRYLELFALEHGGIGDDVPPEIRTKSWQRACARLAELRTTAYRTRYAQSRAQGMTPSKARDRAIAAIRQDNAALFARLLAEEYQRWLTQSGVVPEENHRTSHPGLPGTGGNGIQAANGGSGHHACCLPACQGHRHHPPRTS